MKLIKIALITIGVVLITTFGLLGGWIAFYTSVSLISVMLMISCAVIIAIAVHIIELGLGLGC